MATLTQVAYTTRRVIKYGSIGLVLFLIIRVIILAGIAWYNAAHPKPPPPPNTRFGKIPRPKFPEQKNQNIEYSLQLPTVTFQDSQFPDRANIFMMPYKTASFMAPDEAKRQAAGLGFTVAPELISQEIYRWTKRDPVTSTLQMNIIDGSFEYVYTWQEDPNIPVGKNIPGESQAVTETKSYLGAAKKLDADLVAGESKVVYLKLTGSKLIPAVSYSEADFVRVDLFRANINNLTVVTPEPSRGVVSALLSGSANQRFLKVNYNFYPVDYEQPEATYPLITPSAAYESLTKGHGFIASIKENQQKVTVRRVWLGYYDTFTPQDFLQPVYIFTGDDDFIGYIPAIVETWYQ